MAEFGLESFYVGVASEFDGSDVSLTTFPDLCADYRGSIAPGSPFLINCTNVRLSLKKDIETM